MSEVLTGVDREKLVAVVRDALIAINPLSPFWMDAYEKRAKRIVDAILTELASQGVREVERFIPIKHGKKMWSAAPLPGGRCELALLKPKEGE